MASTRALVLSAVLAVASGTNEAFQAGNAHYARGELEEAREAYNECLREQPDRTDCATNLASVLIDLGPQHEAFAEALYRRVLAIEETHADAAFNLALLLQDRNLLLQPSHFAVACHKEGTAAVAHRKQLLRLFATQRRQLTRVCRP